MWMKYYLGYGNLLVALGGLAMGFLVISKNWRDPVKQAFFIFTEAVGFYALFYLPMILSRTTGSYLFYLRLLAIPVVFIAIGNVHFTFEWLDIAKRHRIFLIFIYLFGLVNVPLIFTSWYSTGIQPVPYGYGYIAGPLMYVWMGSYVVLWMVAFFTLLRYYPRLSIIRKRQAMLFFIGNAIGAISGLPNFLWLGGIYPKYPPVTSPLIIFYVLLSGYAIIRYRAMEIDTVIHKTTLWLLSILFLVAPAGILHYLLKPWILQLGLFSTVIFVSGSLLMFLGYYHYLRPRIDHFFRRRKYDYQTVLGKVAEKISTTINIDNLTAQLLTEVCETMYLRNALLFIWDQKTNQCFLSGRRGYQQVNGVKQPDSLEIFTTEDKEKHSPEAAIECNHRLSKWMVERGEVLERERLEIDPQCEPIREEALDWLGKYDIEVLVPLILNNQVNAILGLGKKENLQAYTMSDITLLKKLGEEAGVTVFNALHYKELAETERLEEEMRMGRQIQMMLLPQRVPHISGLMVEGMMEPAKEIGGDYYDFISLPDKDALSIVIGDVSGKGVAAGLLMAMAKTAIHTLSQEESSPMKILLRANQILNQHISGQKFMTMLYFRWQAGNKTLTYSSAGHEHILIYRNQAKKLESIVSGGLMLGMIPDIETFLEEKQIQFDPGDKILLYTDGVTEALNKDQERFGLERLKEVFQTHNDKSPQALMGLVKDEVYDFIGDVPQYDDITLVVLEAV